MTIKELYEKAIVDGIEDYEIKLQYQDDGGFYNGSCLMSCYEFDPNKEEVTFS